MCEMNEIIENLKIWLVAVENQSSGKNLLSKMFDPEWFASMVDLEISIKTAIQALEEKQEREQGCEHCKEPTKLMEIHDCELGTYGTCYIHKASDGTAIFTNKSPVSYLDIDYCPMCGRRLNRESDRESNKSL